MILHGRGHLTIKLARHCMSTTSYTDSATKSFSSSLLLNRQSGADFTIDIVSLSLLQIVQTRAAFVCVLDGS